jgi:CPA2 family monovalent cation:H+ antiporter-2
MAVAESGRSHVVEEAIEPLKSLFSALFFVSIGMSVDPVIAWTTLPLAGLLFGLVVGIQLLSVTLASLLSGFSLRRSVYTGVALGQVGELSFILATIAIAGGIAPEGLLPALVTVATLTAFTTPLLLGRAETIVSILDRILPDRITDFLEAYQSFLRRAGRSTHGPSMGRPAIAVSLDWSALVILLVARITLDPILQAHGWLANGLLVLMALPLVVGLGRSSISLGRAVNERLSATATPPAVARAVVALLVLTVVLSVALPTAAVMQPLVPGSLLEASVVLTVVGSLTFVAVRLRGVQGDYTSAVARFASSVQRRLDDDPAASPMLPFAGLDYSAVKVPPGAPAAGQSLAELNLRCRTGATVVAIWRPEGTIVLPTGRERIASGDAIALSGTDAAVERARALLVDPAGNDGTPSDGPCPEE